MPSLKPSNPFRRGADRPSLKQRLAGLKSAASRVMSRRQADPLDGTSCPPGFVPYPFERPMSYASVPAVIHAEAMRLLDLAADEFSRRCELSRGQGDEANRDATRWAARRALRLDALAALVDFPARSAPTHDPVLAPIARYQEARRAWAAHTAMIDRPGAALGDRSAALTRDGDLGAACSLHVAEILATVPTTLAGRLALADFVAGWVEEHGHTDGTPQDGSETVFGDVFPALLAALRASSTGHTA